MQKPAVFSVDVDLVDFPGSASVCVETVTTEFSEKTKQTSKAIIPSIIIKYKKMNCQLFKINQCKSG